MKIYRKGAFTLTELVIATVLSTVVLLIVFGFIADELTQVADLNQEERMLDSLYSFVDTTREYRSLYSSGAVIINSSSTGGYDILMFKNETSTEGLLIGVVNAETKKLMMPEGFNIYSKKNLGIRKLTAQNITDITTSSSNAYSLVFYDDKLFPRLNVKNFQADLYNTSTIFNLDISLFIEYNPNWAGQSWSDLPQDIYYNYALNF